MMEVVVQRFGDAERIDASSDPWGCWIGTMLDVADDLVEGESSSVHMVDPDRLVCQYNGCLDYIDEDIFGLHAAVIVQWYDGKPVYSGAVGDGFYGAASAVLRGMGDGSGAARTYGERSGCAPVLILSMPEASEADVLQASKDHADAFVVVVL